MWALIPILRTLVISKAILLPLFKKVPELILGNIRISKRYKCENNRINIVKFQYTPAENDKDCSKMLPES